MRTCECGCGSVTPIAKKTRTADGYRKGEHIRFVPGHQACIRVGALNPMAKRTGETSPSWKGGRNRHSRGYVLICMQEHPRASGGQVLEHIVIAERALGKPLPARAEVHHVNGDRADNRTSNLVICQDRAYHMLLHARARARANTRKEN